MRVGSSLETMAPMAAFLDWFAAHNTLVIQIGFTIVLLLIASYVYRLFTTSSPTSTGDFSGNLSGVEQKINQILENQKISGKMGDSARQSEGLVTSVEEVDQLKSEIYNLRQQLNESEKKIFEMAPASSAAPADVAVPASENNTLIAEKVARIEELNKEVDVLKAKLSDYEIIAEDISDLSDLRKENEELRKKLEGMNSGEHVQQAVSTQQDMKTSSDVLPDINFDEALADTTKESLTGTEHKGDS